MGFALPFSHLYLPEQSQFLVEDHRGPQAAIGKTGVVGNFAEARVTQFQIELLGQFAFSRVQAEQSDSSVGSGRRQRTACFIVIYSLANSDIVASFVHETHPDQYHDILFAMIMLSRAWARLAYLAYTLNRLRHLH